MIVETKIQEKKEWENPTAGSHAGVLVDVVDLGLETMTNDKGDSVTKPKVRLVFEIDQKMSDDRPMLVQRKVTASMHEMSNLYAIIETWLGRAPTPEEQARFDLGAMIGASANLMIIHTKDKNDPEKIWANIDRVYPAEKKLKPSGDYIRVQNR
jgi:hypothetical protein